MGKRKGKRRRSPRREAKKSTYSPTTGGDKRWIIIAATAVVIVLAGVLAWRVGLFSSSTAPGADAVAETAELETPLPLTQPPASTPLAAPTPTLAAFIGPPTECRARPRFISELGMGGQIYIGTNLQGYTGLTLSARDPNNGQMLVYQHPSWDDAGNLAPYALDRAGNIYVGPAPFVSLDNNPPELQNRIYRVDGESGEMSLFVELPAAQPPSSSNPFGVMGLAYDCDTDSLYASSLAGSTYDAELGRIFQIDVNSASVVSRLENVDAFGVGSYQGAQGKRLYFGSARDSSVRSVPLDDEGHFDGEQRVEFYLLAAPGGGDDRAKRIQFPERDQMRIKGIEFNYTLRAASDFKERDYAYRYQPLADTWEFEDVHWREEDFQ
jgi:hypothetical protein